MEARTGEVRPAQVGAGQDRAAQVRAGEVRALQVEAGQDDPAQVRAAEVEVAQVLRQAVVGEILQRVEAGEVRVLVGRVEHVDHAGRRLCRARVERVDQPQQRGEGVARVGVAVQVRSGDVLQVERAQDVVDLEQVADRGAQARDLQSEQPVDLAAHAADLGVDIVEHAENRVLELLGDADIESDVGPLQLEFRRARIVEREEVVAADAHHRLAVSGEVDGVRQRDHERQHRVDRGRGLDLQQVAQPGVLHLAQRHAAVAVRVAHRERRAERQVERAVLDAAADRPEVDVDGDVACVQLALHRDRVEPECRRVEQAAAEHRIEVERDADPGLDLARERRVGRAGEVDEAAARQQVVDIERDFARRHEVEVGAQAQLVGRDVEAAAHHERAGASGAADEQRLQVGRDRADHPVDHAGQVGRAALVHASGAERVEIALDRGVQVEDVADADADQVVDRPVDHRQAVVQEADRAEAVVLQVG